MFMHGGWEHIIFNMLFLWIFGNNVEDAPREGALPPLVPRGRPRRYRGADVRDAPLGLGPGREHSNIGASGAIAAVLGGPTWCSFRTLAS